MGVAEPQTPSVSLSRSGVTVKGPDRERALAAGPRDEVSRAVPAVPLSATAVCGRPGLKFERPGPGLTVGFAPSSPRATLMSYA